LEINGKIFYHSQFEKCIITLDTTVRLSVNDVLYYV